jgi:hypothetical protein
VSDLDEYLVQKRAVLGECRTQIDNGALGAATLSAKRAAEYGRDSAFPHADLRRPREAGLAGLA